MKNFLKEIFLSNNKIFQCFISVIIVASGEITSSSLPSTQLKLKITATLACIFGLRSG